MVDGAELQAHRTVSSEQGFRLQDSELWAQLRQLTELVLAT
jgi:hypothetical protein